MIIFFFIPAGAILVVFAMLLLGGIAAAENILNIVVMVLPWLFGLLCLFLLLVHIISCMEKDYNDKIKLRMDGVVLAILNIPACIACHYYLYLLLNAQARHFLIDVDNGIVGKFFALMGFIFVFVVGGLLYLVSIGSAFGAIDDQEETNKRVKLEILSLIMTALLIGFTIYCLNC